MYANGNSILRSRLAATLGELQERDLVTRKMLADAADTSLTTVGTWFAGERTPDLDHYENILASKMVPDAAKLAIASAVHTRTGLVVRDESPLPATEAAGDEFSCLRQALQLTEKADAIWDDKFISPQEHAEYVVISNQLRTAIDHMDARMAARSGGRRLAVVG